jgi:hypothetical protein
MSPTARNLRQVSSDFKEGRISAEQKHSLKEQILMSNATAPNHGPSSSRSSRGRVKSEFSEFSEEVRL